MTEANMSVQAQVCVWVWRPEENLSNGILQELILLFETESLLAYNVQVRWGWLASELQGLSLPPKSWDY